MVWKDRGKHWFPDLSNMPSPNWRVDGVHAGSYCNAAVV